jgi:hypothetical protein
VDASEELTHSPPADLHTGVAAPRNNVCATLSEGSTEQVFIDATRFRSASFDQSRLRSIDSAGAGGAGGHDGDGGATTGGGPTAKVAQLKNNHSRKERKKGSRRLGPSSLSVDFSAMCALSSERDRQSGPEAIAPSSASAPSSDPNALLLARLQRVQNLDMLHEILLRLVDSDADLTAKLSDLLTTALLDPVGGTLSLKCFRLVFDRWCCVCCCTVCVCVYFSVFVCLCVGGCGWVCVLLENKR